MSCGKIHRRSNVRSCDCLQVLTSSRQSDWLWSPSSSAWLAVPPATTSGPAPCLIGAAAAIPALQQRTLDRRWAGSQTQSPAPAAAALRRIYQKSRTSLKHRRPPLLLLRLNVEEERRQEERRRARKTTAGQRRWLEELHLSSLSPPPPPWLLTSPLWPSCPALRRSSPPSACRCCRRRATTTLSLLNNRRRNWRKVQEEEEEEDEKESTVWCIHLQGYRGNHSHHTTTTSSNNNNNIIYSLNTSLRSQLRVKGYHHSCTHFLCHTSRCSTHTCRHHTHTCTHSQISTCAGTVTVCSFLTLHTGVFTVVDTCPDNPTALQWHELVSLEWTSFVVWGIFHHL